MITLALALLLSQVTPSLSSRVQHDATGEGFLVGWGYAQVPAVTCTQYPNSRTNSFVKSQAFNDALWAKDGNGVAAPTITPNYAADPFGQITAERMQFPATVGAQYSRAYQATGQVGVRTNSIYLRGTSASGSITMITSAPLVCTTCAFTATAWSRCQFSENITSTGYILFGTDSGDCGGAANAAADVLVSSVQQEAGSVATPYVFTDGSAATAPPGCY